MASLLMSVSSTSIRKTGESGDWGVGGLGRGISSETLQVRGRDSSARIATMTHHLLRLPAGVAVLAVLALQSAPSSAPADREWALPIDALTSPAGESSSAPQLTTTGDRSMLSWMERANPASVLKFAERTAAGWSEPKTVASGNDLVVNAADVPSVRALADGSLAAAWMVANSPDPEAYDLRLAWSKDAGATW